MKMTDRRKGSDLQGAPVLILTGQFQGQEGVYFGEETPKGRVIGRNGQTIHAIRTLLASSAAGQRGHARNCRITSSAH
jgi:hypothetical protein